ncbi:MAG: hypothetical protein HC923_04020 [Myxococcales bacterium]|nr:hypothetical protein [Myxococcales bacterium]
MTDAQVRGWELFKGDAKCIRCHVQPVLHGVDEESLFANLGLVDSSGDTGRQQHTGLEADRGKFKTPGLRNVGLREPAGLLHDGAGDGRSLELIMEAYNNPKQLDVNTDERMLASETLNLTEAQISDLIDFMRNALTDPRAEANAYPFDKPTLNSER